MLLLNIQNQNMNMKTTNTRNLLLFLTVVIFSVSSHAQSLYEVQFKDKNNVVYTGFLVYFNESNSYMRIAYEVNKIYKVVNVDYIAKTGKLASGTNYFVMTGSNPSFITTAQKDEGYNPDFFVWTWEENEKESLPYTTDTSDPKYEHLTKVISYKKMNASSLTDTYLRRFFGTGEGKYSSLKKLCGIDLVARPDYSNMKMYFILVANTLITDIGKSCAVDRDNLRTDFRNIASAMNIDFQEYIIDGANFSKNTLSNTLNNLNPSSRDIIVFIYRGHGFRWSDQNKKDWAPVLDLRSSEYLKISDATSINLSSVDEIIERKGARLNIILGDCCNSDVGISKVYGSKFFSNQSNNRLDANKLSNLFVRSKGTILSSSSSPGEVSWTDNNSGGVFTTSFIQALKEDISYLSTANPRWENIISKTITLARNKTSRTLCPDCTLQNGMYYSTITAND